MACSRGPKNRSSMIEMTKNFNNKMVCFNHRLKKWSKVFKKPVFTFKTKDKYDESLEVIPVEKYFDYLMDIHVIHTDHGDIDKMMKTIREEGLWIPFEAVYVFYRYCPKCSLSRKREFHRHTVRSQMNQVYAKYRMRGFVEIIDMSSKPDGEYKYILHYRDLSTQFSRLRPLKNPVASEVATELFQIFMTSGAPAVIHTPVKRTFTAAIIKHLEPLMPDIKILVGNQKASCKKEDKIPNLVDKWMNNGKNGQWSIGIYYVESDMNGIKKKSRQGMSAYKAMFERTQGTGLIKRFSNGASRALFKKLQNEEDLLLPSVEKYVVAAGEELTATLSSVDDEVWNEWCAVCGNDFADSLCDVCGVAKHLRCNAEQQRLCDYCNTFTTNHKHKKILLQHDNIGIDTQADNVVGETDKQLLNVDKILKTYVQPAKDPEIPAHSAEVLETVGPTEDIASTSTQPNNVVNLVDNRLELKVGRIIQQYSKPKKSGQTTVKDHDYATFIYCRYNPN